MRKEYQRKPASLALIWRGIGEYLVRNPHYKILFGPVSISKEYQGLSRRLMVEFLESHRSDQTLGGLVKAKNPPTPAAGQGRAGGAGIAGEGRR